MSLFFSDFGCNVMHPASGVHFRGILKVTPYQLAYDQTTLNGHDLILIAPTKNAHAIQRLDVLQINAQDYRVLEERMEDTGLSYFSLEKLDED